MSITIRNLTLTYPGDNTAIKNISIHTAPGTVLGLAGTNGAGKSSLMRILATALSPTSGSVSVNGLDPATHPDQVRAMVGYCPDVGGLPRAHTLRECVGMTLAATSQLELWPHALELVGRFELTSSLDVVTGAYSHGMARRTSALLAILSAREVLLLDEPFDGVDALGAQVITDLIGAASARGVTVVVCTHLVDVLTQVADTVVVMAHGRIVGHLDPKRLKGRRGRARYARLLAGARR